MQINNATDIEDSLSSFVFVSLILFIYIYIFVGTHKKTWGILRHWEGRRRISKKHKPKTFGEYLANMFGAQGERSWSVEFAACWGRICA